MNLIKMLFGSPAHCLSPFANGKSYSTFWTNKNTDRRRSKQTTKENKMHKIGIGKGEKQQQRHPSQISSDTLDIYCIFMHLAMVSWLCLVFLFGHRTSPDYSVATESTRPFTHLRFMKWPMAKSVCMNFVLAWSAGPRRATGRSRNAISTFFPTLLLRLLCYWFGLLLLAAAAAAVAAAKKFICGEHNFLWTFFNLKI